MQFQQFAGTFADWKQLNSDNAIRLPYTIYMKHDSRTNVQFVQCLNKNQCKYAIICQLYWVKLVKFRLLRSPNHPGNLVCSRNIRLDLA